MKIIKTSRTLWAVLLLLSTFVAIYFQNKPILAQSSGGGVICRVALIFDRSTSIPPAGLDAMRSQVRRLFQVGGLNDPRIELAFWSFSSSTSTHTPGYTPPPGNQNAPFYGFVSSAGLNSGFNTAMASITPLGQTNYLEGFGFSKPTASSPMVTNAAIQSIVDPANILVFMTDGEPNEPEFPPGTYFTPTPMPANLGRDAVIARKNEGKIIIGGFIGSVLTGRGGRVVIDPATGQPVVVYDGLNTLRYVINGSSSDNTNIFTIEPDFDNLSILLRNKINASCSLLTPPSVDLKVNRSDAPPAINVGDPITVSWSAANVTNCTSSGQWVGTPVPPPGGSVPRNGDSATSGTKTYSIACNNSSGATVTDTVSIVVNGPPPAHPYLRTYGGDIRAGASFDTVGGSCSISAVGNSGIIHTYASAAGGAGSQFAAIAAGQITEFASAMLKTTNPLPPTGFTFANTGVGVNTVPPENGGSFTNNNCISTYAQWNPPTNIVANPSSINVSAIATGSSLMTGNLTIRGGVVSGLHALYVDGDVHITNSGGSPGIFYNNAGTGWGSISQIPQFYLIARGNIYIDKDVTNLDGMYIATPRDDNNDKDPDPGTGIIYTCSVGFAKAPPSALNNQCKSQLTVNGSLTAQKIHFTRLLGSDTDAVAIENPFGPARSCTNVSGTRPICASEIFILGAEAYLPSLAPNPTASLLNLQYDYVIALPPVF